MNTDLYNSIKVTHPMESDFDDELLEEFDRHERYLIYCGMPDWCGQPLSDQFLRRRLGFETVGLARRTLEGGAC